MAYKLNVYLDPNDPELEMVPRGKEQEVAQRLVERAKQEPYMVYFATNSRGVVCQLQQAVNEGSMESDEIGIYGPNKTLKVLQRRDYA